MPSGKYSGFLNFQKGLRLLKQRKTLELNILARK